MSESTVRQLPEGITRDHVLRAIMAFDEHGMPGGFKPSHTYELIHEGKSYPPPAIIALAAENSNGLKVAPGFRVGKGTQCFQILEQCGFEISVKASKNG